MRADLAITAINRLLADHPELADDPILRADMIEGETDAFAIIERLARAADQRKSYAASDRATAQEFAEVARRHEAAAERMRGAILDLMLAADMTKLRLPSGGMVNVGQSKPSPQIQSPGMVPESLCTITPSMTAIRAYIEAEGVLPPGVAMSNGAPFVRITK